MKLKELIDQLTIISEQSELGSDTPVLLVENWHSLGAVQQEVRDIDLTDITFGKVNAFPIIRNNSECVEGIIIGYLNTYE